MIDKISNQIIKVFPSIWEACKNNILGILQRFVVKKEKLLMDINGNIYLNYIPTYGQNLSEE